MPSSSDIQLKIWLKDIDRAVKGYEKKDKKKILQKGAHPVWLAAVSKTPVRGKRKTKNKLKGDLNPRYRFLGKGRRKAGKGKGRPVAWYAKGNLKDSISIISFRRTSSVFVGPYFRGLSRIKPTVLGSKRFAGDGYYAQMVFGSREKFKNKVLLPARAIGAERAYGIIADLTRKSIVKRSGKG